MKKIRTLLLAAAVICSSFPVVESAAVSVQARTDYGYYPMACSAYEVDTVTDDGNFASQGCYDDFASAKTAMSGLGDDAVVRHGSSYSPTKIIAMVSGVVYSYPQRGGTNTAAISQYSSSVPNMKTTYVTVHREAAYFGTDTYDGDGDGMVHINLTGFDGYISLYQTDLVPMKFITNNLTLYLGGNSTYDGESPFNTHIYQGYYEVSQNGSYLDLVYHCYSGWSNDTWPASWSFTVGPAAAWMSAGNIFYSYNGYDFYRDRKFSDKAGTYYNYYQFAPLRTKSNVSAATFNTFLTSRGYDSSSKLWDTGNTFLNAQSSYGVNALSVFAMACLESAYGTSNYAQQRNNLFGWNAFDSDPDQASYFSSVDQAINEHMGINLRGYLDINDYRYFGGQLGNKGSGLNVKYAGDPYWGMKIAAIAYAIDKTDNNNDGTLTDCDTASLGLIKDYGINILSSAGGAALYNSAYGATYQMNHIVSILGESGDYYKIQSTSYLSGSSVLSLSGQGLLNYDWNSNIGWLPKAEVDRLNNTTVTPSGTEPTGDVVQTLTSVAFQDGKLIMSGQAYRPGIYVTDANRITQTLSILDMTFAEKASAVLTSSVADNDQVTWQLNGLDLSTLGEGSYLLKVTSAYSTYTDYSNSYYLKPTVTLPQDLSRNGLTYHFAQTDDTADALLKLTVSKTDCGANASYSTAAGACVCLDGYENWTAGTGCTAKPTATPTPTPTATASTDHTVIQSVKSAAYLTDGKTVHIEGTAFITGMDFSTSAAVSHRILLVNMESKTTTAFAMTTGSVSQPVSQGDGYDYTQISYSGDIDLSTLDPGNYYLKIEVTNGTTTLSRLMVANSESMTLPIQTDGSNQIRFFNDSLANYRLEVSIETPSIDRSLISKPTRRNSAFGYTAITLTDGILQISGDGYLYNTYTDAANHPVYQLILADESGKLTDYAATAKACTVDYAALRGSAYSVKNACFDTTADLTALPAGTYRVYLDAKTDAARDLYELYDIRQQEIPAVTYNGRTYRLSATDTRSRMILTITDN